MLALADYKHVGSKNGLGKERQLAGEVTAWPEVSTEKHNGAVQRKNNQQLWVFLQMGGAAHGGGAEYKMGSRVSNSPPSSVFPQMLSFLFP